MALQNVALGKKIHSLCWFDIGMNLGDLMQMQLAIPVLLTFNLSAAVLLENHANEYGRSWQSLFKWTRKEWAMLGYNAVEYRQKLRLNLEERPHNKIEILEQWGPDDNCAAILTTTAISA